MPESVRIVLLKGDTAAIIMLILVGMVFLLSIGWLIMSLRLRRLSRQMSALSRGVEGRNLEELLVGHMDTVAETVRRMDVLEQAVAVLQAQIPGCLQRVNMVRYDAFDDVGGEMSFSLAMLNATGDGIVLTSVYSRNDVRVYAKSVRNGRASHALSREEERVLREVSAH